VDEGGHFSRDFTLEDGWFFTTKTGVYGTSVPATGADYRDRTRCQSPQDADLPDLMRVRTSFRVIAARRSTSCLQKWRVAAGQGFWSLTMYDAAYFFVPKPRSIGELSQRDKLTTNPDVRWTSTFSMSHRDRRKKPTGYPAPADRFILMLRMYWPNEKRLRSS